MALLWLPALTAHAGSYSAPVYSGGTFYGQGYQGPGTQPFGPVSTSTGPGWGGGSGGVPSATAGGAITATFTWQPAYGKTMATDPSPAHILVIETSSASGTALCAPATVPGTVSCNDGLGPNGAVSTTTYPGYSVTTSSCQDVRKTLMSNKQTVTVTCSPQVSATGNQSASSASVSYSASIQLDTRAVTISADADVTSYKVLTGGVDANGDGNWAKVLHTPDPDGTMKGDIGIPYGEQHTVQVPDGLGGTTSKLIVTNTSQNAKYTGTIIGSWATQNSQYWWNSSLKNYSLNGSLFHLYGLGVPNESEIPTLTNVYVGPIVDDDHNGAIIPNDAGFNGTTDHLFFKFQNGDNRTVFPSPEFATGNDGDGATATANYYMTVHQAIESFPSHKQGILQPGEAQDNIIYRDAQLTVKSSPAYATLGNGIECDWNAPAPFWGYTADALTVLGNAPWPNKWIGVSLAAASVAITDFGPKHDSAIIIFNSDTWNDPASQFPSQYPKGSKPMIDYWMIPCQHLRYLRHYALNDNYGVKGFEGESMIMFDTYNGKGPSYGNFTWAGAKQ